MGRIWWVLRPDSGAGYQILVCPDYGVRHQNPVSSAGIQVLGARFDMLPFCMNYVAYENILHCLLTQQRERRVHAGTWPPWTAL